MHAMVHGPMWAQFTFLATNILIVVLYSIIAWQFWDARSNERVSTGSPQKAKRALGELVAIFVLCALSGYVPKIIFKLFPSSPPDLWVYMLGSHTLLVLWASKYVLGRQASHLMARLN